MSDTQNVNGSAVNQNGVTKSNGASSEGLELVTERLSLGSQPGLAPIGVSRPSRLTLNMSEDTDHSLDESNDGLIPSASLHPRDPRTASETLEGVVTPRNEAGPFVFDGSGRRGNQRPMTAVTTSSVEEAGS